MKVEIDQYDLGLIYERISNLEYDNEKLLERVEELETTPINPDISQLADMIGILAQSAHLKRALNFAQNGEKTRKLPVSTLADFSRIKGRLSPRISRSRSRRRPLPDDID